MPQRIAAKQMRAALLCTGLMLVGVFALPYLVPVVPTTSLSYMVGFNNRVAMAAFLLGALGIAISLGGWIGEPDPEDSKLPRTFLWVSVIAAALLCIGLRVHRSGTALGVEAQYLLDRQHQLELHKIPYREFEYAYGPLLLYPAHILHTVLKVPEIPAYYMVWGTCWCLGIAMFFAIMATIDIPTRYRKSVYALGILVIPAYLLQEGMNYVPLRLTTAPFLALCLFQFWKRTRAPYRTALVAWVAIILGFGVSSEQGVGLLCGLSLYLLLLVFRSKEGFPLPAALLQIALSAGIAGLAWHFNMLLAMRSFSLGGYNFPLLPSPINLLILTLYGLAISVVWRAVRDRDLQHNHVVLVLCGIPMLPAAMGRCDTGHLIAASGAYYVGLFALHSRRSLGRFLVPALWVLLIASFYGSFLNRHFQKLIGHPEPEPPSYVAAAGSKPIPADRTYYSPFTTSISLQRVNFVPFPIDEGYYSAMENLNNERQLQDKLEEFQRHQGMPLILPDKPTAAIPPVWDLDPSVLREYELFPVAPKAKRPSMSTVILTDFILLHYRPTNMAQDDRRVWEPIPGS